MNHRPTLSIIIPVKESEPKLVSLIAALELCLKKSYVSFEILVSTASKTLEQAHIFSNSTKVLYSEVADRAYQLTLAAQAANAEWLLFLHADSDLSSSAIDQLLHVLKTPSSQNSLYYFWLKFDSDGPFLCRLNSFFANLRSRLLGIPFGDQGLLIRRESFFRLGLFPLRFISGEDHAFIRVAKKNGFSILPINANITTSARKYRDLGWFNITAKHFYLAMRQELKGSNNFGEGKHD